MSTKFTLVSGNAKLQLVVTKNGSDKRLTLLKGSRLGSTIASSSGTPARARHAKPATFPIKVVLPAQGFSLTEIYVIRITATSATGAASTLDLGFKGAKLISKRTSAKRSGADVGRRLDVLGPGRQGDDVQAWVTRGVGTTKATLLKGSRLGAVQAKRSATVLRLRSAKAGRIAIRVALSGSGFSLKQTYVIHVETKSSGGLWTDYEIRFKGARAGPRGQLGNTVDRRWWRRVNPGATTRSRSLAGDGELVGERSATPFSSAHCDASARLLTPSLR